MQQDSVEETADAQPKQNTGRDGKCRLFAIIAIHLHAPRLPPA